MDGALHNNPARLPVLVFGILVSFVELPIFGFKSFAIPIPWIRRARQSCTPTPYVSFLPLQVWRYWPADAFYEEVAVDRAFQFEHLKMFFVIYKTVWLLTPTSLPKLNIPVLSYFPSHFPWSSLARPLRLTVRQQEGEVVGMVQVKPGASSYFELTML